MFNCSKGREERRRGERKNKTKHNMDVNRNRKEEILQIHLENTKKKKKYPSTSRHYC
jgi:hypothetical protein